MASIPQRAKDLMAPGKVMALATASAEGDPNVAPMHQCWWIDGNTMVVGDFFMKQTKKNIEENPRASFSVWQMDPPEGYKFKGSARYLTAGPEYEFANTAMKKKMPEKDFKGVVVIAVQEVYDMKSGPAAGALIKE